MGWDTVTKKVCVAVKLPGSVAVTVIVAVPAATAVMLTVVSEVDTVALAVSEEVAVWVNVSLSASLK